MKSFKHILLADDDKDDVEMFLLAVKQCCLNIKVSAVEDGRMLLTLLRTGPLPDMIVLDLNMPRMNGYECLRLIRESDQYNQVPVMILSTSSSEKDMNDCLSNGADYYATKPQTIHELRDIVDDVCGEMKDRSFKPK